MDSLGNRSWHALGVWLAVAVLALAATLAAQRWLGARLAALETLSASEPEAARHGAEELLRALLRAAAAFPVLCGLLFGRMAQLGRREGRFPPRGVLSLGVRRIATGEPARRRALALMVLSALLVGAGIALLLLGEHLVGSLTQPLPAP